MLAAIKTEKSKEIVVGEIDCPVLKKGEVLIKVSNCGVCGSDLHAYNHSKGYEFIPKPIILGHEIAGKVVEVYDSSLTKWIGKNVIVESIHYCATCKNCQEGRKHICNNRRLIGLHKNGGMCEYVKAKAVYVKEIPGRMPMQIAALSEPLSIAVHAVDSIAHVQKDQVVLVQGPGIIGFFVSLVCMERGARVILSGLEQDYESRLSKCLDFGITPHIADKKSLTEKIDVVFECSGSNLAVDYGFRHLKKGGKAVIVALYEESTNLFLTHLVRNEWSILTSYGCNPEDYKASFEILIRHSELLKKIISIYPLEKVAQAFRDGIEKKVLKPIISIC